MTLKGKEGFTSAKSRDPELRDSAFLTERTVLLKGLRPGTVYDVHVTFRDMEGNRVTKEFVGVEVIAEAPARTHLSDNLPPRITNVSVGPLEKGPFLSTSISWETDEPSTSMVLFGFTERYGEIVERDDVWVKRHLVPVHGLRKGRQYHFSVVSRDVFGNESRSEDFALTTDPLPLSAATMETGMPVSRGRLAVSQAQVFLVGSDLGLYLETTKPSRVQVECLRRYAPINTTDLDSGNTRYEVRLDGLRKGRDLTIEACYQYGCHPPAELGISHPVGIPLSNTTPIPINLPTLEGGIITCVSCHQPHGGERKHLAQDDFSRNLCVTCHREF